MKYLFVFLLVGLTSEVNAQTETVKQPICDEIDGLKVVSTLKKKYKELKSTNYTGVAFKCIGEKVVGLWYFQDGKHEGIQKEWHENGQLYREWIERNGMYAGLKKMWYENGQLCSLENWRCALRDGRLTNWEDGLSRQWHANGQLSSEKNWKDGEEDGLSRQWHANGQLSSEAYWKDGEEDGVWKTWRKNGQLRSECKMKGYRAIDGLRREWHENGQLSSEGHYVADPINYKDGCYKTGIHREWDENGELKYEGNWKDGQEHGLQRSWHENGQLYREAILNENVRLYKIWYDNGQLSFEVETRNRDMISQKCFDEDGNKKECTGGSYFYMKGTR